MRWIGAGGGGSGSAINTRAKLLPLAAHHSGRQALIHLTLNILPFVELLLIAMAKVAGVIGGVAVLLVLAVMLGRRLRRRK
jgi:hypothetical protein